MKVAPIDSDPDKLGQSAAELDYRRPQDCRTHAYGALLAPLLVAAVFAASFQSVFGQSLMELCSESNLSDYDATRDADDFCKLAFNEPDKARRQLDKMVALNRQLGNQNRYYFPMSDVVLQLRRDWMDGTSWQVVRHRFVKGHCHTESQLPRSDLNDSTHDATRNVPLERWYVFNAEHIHLIEMCGMAHNGVYTHDESGRIYYIGFASVSEIRSNGRFVAPDVHGIDWKVVNWDDGMFYLEDFGRESTPYRHTPDDVRNRVHHYLDNEVRSATSTTTPEPLDDAYDITLEPLRNTVSDELPPAKLDAAMRNAAAKWEAMVAEDFPGVANITLGGPGHHNTETKSFWDIDDLLVAYSIDPDYSDSDAVAYSFDYGERLPNGNRRSLASHIVFAKQYVDNATVELLTIAAAHELGHAVILNFPHAEADDYSGNVNGGRWTGKHALAAYRDLRPFTQAVPMSGRTHWSRDFIVPRRDVMQPRWFGNSKIGAITAGAMRDYGYKVNDAGVESYTSATQYSRTPLFQCVESPTGGFMVKMLAE